MREIAPLNVSVLIARGYCCGFKCKNCPYYPKYIKDNEILDNVLLNIHMAFEAKLLTESKNKQAKLLRAAKKAVKEPDTGVKIIRKSAYYVIRDCAKVTELYLPHYIYSQLKNPIQMLEGVFTKAECTDFLARAKKDLVTNQLLNLIIIDIKKQNLLESAGLAKTPSLDPGRFDEVDDDDIYGDYESTGFTEAAEPDVIVEVEKNTLQLLLDAFNVKS